MKKKLFGIISIILSICTILSMTACDKNQAPTTNGNGNQVITFSNVDLTKNARTDYSIVIPENYNQYEEYAAQELQLYLKEATNTNFSIQIDNGFVYDNTCKYISIGRTGLLAKSGIKVDVSKVGEGYVIKRDGNLLLLCGGKDVGTLYGVYEFLHLQVGFEAYAVDEIHVNKSINVKLIDVDLVDIPDIQSPWAGFYSGISDPYFAAKWKCSAGASGMPFGGEKWYYFGHSMFRVVPPTQYRAENPTWYSADGIQPCFTSEGFKKQYIENVKELFLSMPELIYVGVGLEDVNNSMCSCDSCQVEIDKYTKAGLVIRWTNEVCGIVREWAKDVELGREIYFPFIAYYETAQAPAEVNEKTGKYEPIDKSCILNEYSPVVYARIDSNWSAPWTDKSNEAFMFGLEEWKACAKSFMFYNYTNNFAKCFEWWDSLYVITQNYQLAAKENAVQFTDDSSNSMLNGFAFQKMFGYISAKLQWDADVDTNELVVDFIENYYKEAADEVLEYYYLMKIQFAKLTNFNDQNDAVDRGVMDRAIVLLRKGISDIQSAPYYTDIQKDNFIQRIELEMFTPIQYILDYLDSEYSTKAYLAYVDLMEEMVGKYGIANLCWWEGQAGYKPNEEVFAAWRGKKSV